MLSYYVSLRPLRFPYKNDDLWLRLFVGGLMSYFRYLCLCIVVSNTYCVVVFWGFSLFLFLFFALFYSWWSSSCVLFTQCFQFLWIDPFGFFNVYFIDKDEYVSNLFPLFSGIKISNYNQIAEICHDVKVHDFSWCIKWQAKM